MTVVGADAGLHVVAWLNRVPRRRENELVARAKGAGLGLYAVGPLYDRSAPASRPDLAGLVMGYASLGEQDIERGVHRLAAVLEELAAPAET